MAKTSLHALLTLKKHMTGFLEINFGGFCRSVALMISCCLPLSLSNCQPEVCVRVNCKQSKPFHVGIGLRQGCILSSLLFIIYMNWIDKCSQINECATIENCKINIICCSQMIWFCFLPLNLSPTCNKWLCSCMWQRWDENQHFQNWSTSSFESILGWYSWVIEGKTKKYTPEWAKLVQWWECCNIRLSWNENCCKMQSSQFSEQFLSPSSPMVLSLG